MRNMGLDQPLFVIIQIVGIGGHFSNYRTLERHRETFHKTAELQCPYCEKMYKEEGNLAHHIEVAHKGKPYFQCDICGGFYSSKKSLQGHQRKDHNS